MVMSMCQSTKMCELAEALVDRWSKRGLFQDVAIYVAGDRWTPCDSSPNDHRNAETEKGTPFHRTRDMKPSRFVEFCNPDTITVTFEGPLYKKLNYSDGSEETALSALFDEYGLYMEYGEAWSFALYPEP